MNTMCSLRKENEELQRANTRVFRQLHDHRNSGSPNTIERDEARARISAWLNYSTPLEPSSIPTTAPPLT
jgi:hypothetical protein